MFALDVQTLTLLHSPKLPLRVRWEDLSGLRPQHLSFHTKFKHNFTKSWPVLATNASDALGDAAPCLVLTRHRAGARGTQSSLQHSLAVR